MNERLEKALNQQESHHREQITRALTEDQHRCLQAFRTSTYEWYKDINPNRVAGTCEWVLKSSEYRRWWESSSNDLLWISADPGCGKSVLAKSLIDEVFHSSAPTASICYFFFKDNDEQNNLATALCAILHQLFGLQPHLLRYALPFWEKNREKIHQGVEDLWHIFMAAMSDLASVNTICVFDALDECRRSDQKQLIGKLQQYYAKHRISPPRNWLKFLVTSRPYDEIEEDFQPIIESFPQIHLRGEEENDQIHDEISLVVKIRMSELGKQLKLKAATEAWLEKALLEMEHRTYLWLYLAIDDIRNAFKDSLRPDQESVPLIPKSVNEAYGKILDRVTPRQEAIVKTILHIIVGARRPLTIVEMAMALGVATAPHARRAEEAGLEPEGLRERIRRLCGLFVFIKDSRIYLIHQTAREFLINRVPGSLGHRWYLQPSDTEIRLTQICIQYLLMDDLVGSGREANLEIFLEYSAQNWADHFRLVSSPMPELLESVVQLYNNTKRLNLWFSIFWETVMPYHTRPQMNALHISAFNGHDVMISKFTQGGKSEINERDSTGASALQWASLRGHFESVQQLLEKGAKVNAQGGEYGNALQAASSKEHVEIVQRLLEKGAEVNAQGGAYGNALYAASFRGHVEIVQELLEKGADVNAQGGEYGNALQAASFGGHIEVVQELLEKGAKVNAQGGEYGNALQAASFGGHIEVVQELLEEGAEVNMQGGRYDNALQAASSGGHVEIVQRLLKNGAEVNAQGGVYGNALYAASSRGHVDVVQVLQKYVSANQKPRLMNTSHRRTRRIIDNPVQSKRKRIRN
jgi:ankyrin repeat protein